MKIRTILKPISLNINKSCYLIYLSKLKFKYSDNIKFLIDEGSVRLAY